MHYVQSNRKPIAKKANKFSAQIVRYPHTAETLSGIALQRHLLNLGAQKQGCRYSQMKLYIQTSTTVPIMIDTVVTTII